MRLTRARLLGVDAEAEWKAEADSCGDAMSVGTSSCWSDYEPDHEELEDALSDVDSADGAEGERPQGPPASRRPRPRAAFV